MNDPNSRATKMLPATPEAICEAAAILRQGGLVAFPTETVYGLGVAAENAAALRAMFAAKGRPTNHPVIVHVASAERIDPLVASPPPHAHRLAEVFWPGPMTLILRKSYRINDLVTGGLDTVGLRVPGHPVAQALLREFGGPIAAPSANRFGRVSATRAQHVADELTGHVDLILDGGPCAVGLESTIIDLTGAQPAILRPGAITQQEIAAVLQIPLAAPAASAPRVSGSLPSHYAPQARVEIVLPDDLPRRALELANQGRRVAVLSSQPLPTPLAQVPTPLAEVIVLAVPQDQAEFARQLYSLLRAVDDAGCDVALVSLPAEHGLGKAIADRLRRAAGPRSS